MGKLIFSLVIPLLLIGCAAQGTIVEKRSRLRPDSSMVGTQGVYSYTLRGPTGPSQQPVPISVPPVWYETGGSFKFVLRDSAGNVHSQLVTPEIFARYNVGDYFNDALPPIETKSAKDGTIRTTLHQRSLHSRDQITQTHRAQHRVAKRHYSLKRQTSLARHQMNPKIKSKHSKPILLTQAQGN